MPEAAFSLSFIVNYRLCSVHSVCGPSLERREKGQWWAPGRELSPEGQKLKETDFPLCSFIAFQMIGLCYPVQVVLNLSIKELLNGVESSSKAVEECFLPFPC